MQLYPYGKFNEKKKNYPIGQLTAFLSVRVPQIFYGYQDPTSKAQGKGFKEGTYPYVYCKEDYTFKESVTTIIT